LPEKIRDANKHLEDIKNNFPHYFEEENKLFYPTLLIKLTEIRKYLIDEIEQNRIESKEIQRQLEALNREILILESSVNQSNDLGGSSKGGDDGKRCLPSESEDREQSKKRIKTGNDDDGKGGSSSSGSLGGFSSGGGNSSSGSSAGGGSDGESGSSFAKIILDKFVLLFFYLLDIIAYFFEYISL
jgi:hypothetical protein